MPSKKPRNSDSYWLTAAQVMAILERAMEIKLSASCYPSFIYQLIKTLRQKKKPLENDIRNHLQSYTKKIKDKEQLVEFDTTKEHDISHVLGSLRTGMESYNAIVKPVKGKGRIFDQNEFYALVSSHKVQEYALNFIFMTNKKGQRIFTWPGDTGATYGEAVEERTFLTNYSRMACSSSINVMALQVININPADVRGPEWARTCQVRHSQGVLCLYVNVNNRTIQVTYKEHCSIPSVFSILFIVMCW